MKDKDGNQPDKGKPDFALIAFIPNFLFMALDAYYLAAKDLYSVKHEGKTTTLQIEAFKSFSIWGFYLVLALLIALSRWLVLT